jgi:hypothetical protein
MEHAETCPIGGSERPTRRRAGTAPARRQRRTELGHQSDRPARALRGPRQRRRTGVELGARWRDAAELRTSLGRPHEHEQQGESRPEDRAAGE